MPEKPLPNEDVSAVDELNNDLDDLDDEEEGKDNGGPVTKADVENGEWLKPSQVPWGEFA